MSEDWSSGKWLLEGLKELGAFIRPDKIGTFSTHLGHWGNNIAMASYKASIKVGES
jgi:hypothetical protein